MANHDSAVKAARQTLKRTSRNRSEKSSLRTALKKLRTAIAEKKADEVRTLLPETISRIDKTAKKGVIHARTADRTKSRLSAQARALLDAGR